VPIEIRRFGVGHRRPDGPIGSVGLSGQVLHSDGRGVVSELAFARGARLEPHANPNTSLLIVVEGGGWVGVGDEYTRIAAGEAAVWPADIPHAAWTEHSEMRAIVVELAGADDRETVDGRTRVATVASDDDRPVERGTGQLAARTGSPATHASDEGEPA
jgi:quercetin dioxygenase-like cupin family protein